jgi:hypothetical protein
MKLAHIFPDARVRLLTEAVIALVAAIHAIEHDWHDVGMSPHRGETSRMVEEALASAREVLKFK